MRDPVLGRYSPPLAIGTCLRGIAMMEDEEPFRQHEQRGDLTSELIMTDAWDDDIVAAAGIPVKDSPIVSVGGGIGSFVFYDFFASGGCRPHPSRC